MSADSPEIPADTQLAQVHLADPDREFEVLASVTVPIDRGEADQRARKREFGLTRGGTDTTVPDGEPLALYGSEDMNAQITAFNNHAWGIGYFMHYMETADLENAEPEGAPTDEESMLAALGHMVDVEPYLEEQRSLTMTDRRLRCLDLWEWRVENGDFAAEIYQDEATWRSTTLSGGAERMAKRIASDVPPREKLCYYSAGEAAIHEIDNDRVEYVEGIAMPKQACQAVRHAWIEIDGEVAELTWPWHRYDGAEAVYIGQPVDKAQVKATRERRDHNGAVLLSDEQIETVSAAMATGGTSGGDTQ